MENMIRKITFSLIYYYKVVKIKSQINYKEYVSYRPYAGLVII